MSSRTRGFLALLFAAVLLLPSLASGATSSLPSVASVDWMTLPGAAPTVRFHVQFSNLDGTMETNPVEGSAFAQKFGVFVPNEAMIGHFNVPPIAPNSFFDVFFDVPLSMLPQTQEFIQGGNAPRLNNIVDCQPTDHWDGNIDIQWWDPLGAFAQVNYHIGDIKVCPGAGKSYIHMIGACNALMAWQIALNCAGAAGWTVTLVNEDFTPAPNPLPPLWTGYICMTAAATVAVGDVCCATITFTCGNQQAQVRICGTACEWATPVSPRTWGTIKSLYR